MQTMLMLEELTQENDVHRCGVERVVHGQKVHV